MAKHFYWLLNKGFIITKILMIEDDLELAQIITDYLASFDMEVTNIDSPYQGLSTLKSSKRL